MKVWAATKEFSEGKFLVVRRDGSVPDWPHFVIGARDPAAYEALMAYADKCDELGFDPEYAASVRDLAHDFHEYRLDYGDGDPPAAPHRKDDPAVIAAMRNRAGTITVWRGKNVKKPTPEEQLGLFEPSLSKQ